MTRDDQHEIEELLEEVLQRPEHEQASFLASARVSCESIRNEVHSLLEAARKAGAFLERPPLTAIDALGEVLPGDDGVIGQAIGSYVIDEHIASGGMGRVYRAHRADETFEKQVAIKIVKRGMDTEELLQRFQYERKILASLDHPNIARLLDAGETDDGRPYFVMEFVDGTTITAYARDQRLSVPDRIDLFLKVCAAVQHAHAHLAIHRDLKPGNILINSDGEPKLLDFGIAKALRPDRPDNELTQEEAAPMTLRHAAPEQVRGDPVQMATDVYALGLVLYELLTDQSPYGLVDATPAEYRRAILDVEPIPPSAHRATGGSTSIATRWPRQVSGDLDTIVLKAIRKEPARRYQTVQQLADDLVRLREGRPVLARPDTMGYRIGKFVRRHTIPVVALSALFATLVVGVVSIGALYVETRAQRTAAIQSREEAEAVISFLTDLVGQADPYQGNPDARIRDLLDDSARTVDSRFSDKPLVKARVQATLGRTYTSLGLYDEAQIHLERAFVTLTENHEGVSESLLIDVMSELSRVRWRQGHLDDANSMMTDALARATQFFGEEHRSTLTALNHLGVIKRNRGELEEAARLHEQAVEGFTRIQGPEHEDTLVAKNDLALAYQNLGRLDEAESLLTETLETRRRTLGPSAPATLTSMFNLGTLRGVQGQLDEARALLEDLAARRTDRLGAEHPIVLADRSRLAGILTRLGDMDKAEAILIETLDAQRRALGSEHPDVLGTYNDLASIYRRTDRPEQAADMLREALEIHTSLRGPDHRNTLVLQANLASAYMELDRYEEASLLLLDGIERARATLPQPHRFTGVFLGRYGRCLLELERDEEATSVLHESYEILVEALGATHASTQDVVKQLSDFYESRGAAAEASTWRAKLSTTGDG